jgi:hypothetical protein
MAANQSTSADTVSAKVTGYGVSYAITSILSALLVVLKESNEGVHGLLVAITGHHWITHGLLDVIVFVVLGAVLSRRDMSLRGNTLITTVVGATILSGLIIAGYFIL